MKMNKMIMIAAMVVALFSTGASAGGPWSPIDFRETIGNPWHWWDVLFDHVQDQLNELDRKYPDCGCGCHGVCPVVHPVFDYMNQDAMDDLQAK